MDMSWIMILVIIVSSISVVLMFKNNIITTIRTKRYKELEKSGNSFIEKIIRKYTYIPLELIALDTNLEFKEIIIAFLIDIQKKGFISVKKGMFTIKIKNLNEYEERIAREFFGFQCRKNDTYIASLGNIKTSLENCSEQSEENIIDCMKEWKKIEDYKIDNNDEWCIWKYFNENGENINIFNIYSDYIKTNKLDTIDLWNSLYKEAPV